MSVAIVTGSSGLVGSEAARRFHDEGMDVVGIDNDSRAYFFGESASIGWNTQKLLDELPRFTHVPYDIRNQEAINKLFEKYNKAISLVLHSAAQPSHDWAAKEPVTDFTINANGTLHLLEATRKHCPAATFILTSTNKVYGDRPNEFPLRELEFRYELDSQHPYAEHGIDEELSIDGSKHSLFGVSKLASDVMAQEYGRYFGMNTGVFRGGCLTGPAHSGAQLHGFLSYLVRCAVKQERYTIFGYKGKQVRDNIHSRDLVDAFWKFSEQPRAGAVYNIGGSRHSNCSMLEAIAILEELTGQSFHYQYEDTPRVGDHIWWISDVRKFQKDYPSWEYQYDLKRTLEEMVEQYKVRPQTVVKHEVIDSHSRP